MASINPRCPYCKVRHSTGTAWRCRERDEEGPVRGGLRAAISALVGERDD